MTAFVWGELLEPLRALQERWKDWPEQQLVLILLAPAFARELEQRLVLAAVWNILF